MGERVAKGEGEVKNTLELAVEEMQVRFSSYMDKQGRILVPLRNREEAGIAGIAGADVEVDMIVKRVYEKKED